MSMSEIIGMPPRERDKIWYAETGEGHTIKDWCKKYGLRYSRVYKRLLQGWPLEKALSSEKVDLSNKFLYKGKPYTVSDLMKISGLSKTTLLARIHTYKWPVEKAVETPLSGNSESRIRKHKKFRYRDKMLTYEDGAKLANITVDSLKRRIFMNKMSFEQAIDYVGKYNRKCK